MTKLHTFVVGLTGGIGSGKSAASDYLHKKYHIPIIDADVASRTITDPSTDIGQDTLQKLRQTFGNWVVDNGVYNRKKMRQMVFNYPDKLHILNKIMHPAIYDCISATLMHLDTPAPYVILSAPLLFEAHVFNRSFNKHTRYALSHIPYCNHYYAPRRYDIANIAYSKHHYQSINYIGCTKTLLDLCQTVLVIDVPKHIQIQRASLRDGQNSHVRNIINHQVLRTGRLLFAKTYGYDILDNTKSVSILHQNLDQLHQKYCNKASAFRT